MTCPNTNSKEWKALMDAGITPAQDMKDYFEHGDTIRTPKEVLDTIEKNKGLGGDRFFPRRPMELHTNNRRVRKRKHNINRKNYRRWRNGQNSFLRWIRSGLRRNNRLWRR